MEERSTQEVSHEQSVIRAKAQRSIGILAFAQGELNTARSAWTESVRLARESGEERILVIALVMLGYTVVWTGDAATAESVIQEGMSIAQKIDYKLGIGMMLGLQSNHAATFQHDFAAARAYWEEGIRILREVGSPFFTAIAILGFANLALSQGNFVEARARFDESKKLFDELGDRHMALGVQSELAHIERQLGHYAEAVRLYHQSILAWQELGHRVALAHEFECLAFIACAQSQLQRAACLFGAVEKLRESLNSPMTVTERIEYDQNISAMRAQMDEPDFAAAWSEGRAMTPNQVIDFALKDTNK